MVRLLTVKPQYFTNIRITYIFWIYLGASGEWVIHVPLYWYVYHEGILFTASTTVGEKSNLLVYFYKKQQHKPPSKKKKREKNLSPRNRKACHSISTALLQSIIKVKFPQERFHDTPFFP
jgi:hypothetical protein